MPHLGFCDTTITEVASYDVVEILAIEKTCAGGAAIRATHRGRKHHAATCPPRGRCLGACKRGIIVVDLFCRLEPLADDRHVALDHRATLAAELLGNLLMDLR